MLNRTLIMFAAAAGLFSASTAYGLPGVPKYVPQAYEGKPEYDKFIEKYTALKSKCDLCHKPGADKKAKGHGLNDFGHAVHEHLDDGAFKKLDKTAKDMPEDGQKALQLLVEALQKSEADKNADGKSFGEIMKQGELPAKP